MLIDESLMLFDNQSFVSSVVGSNAIASNIIDLGGTANTVLATGGINFNGGANRYLIILPNTSFAGGTSIDFQLRTGASLSGAVATSNLAIASTTVIADTGVILTSNIPANGWNMLLPVNANQYIDALLTPAGLFTAGSLNAFIDMEPGQTISIPLYPVNSGVAVT